MGSFAAYVTEYPCVPQSISDSTQQLSVELRTTTLHKEWNACSLAVLRDAVLYMSCNKGLPPSLMSNSCNDLPAVIGLQLSNVAGRRVGQQAKSGREQLCQHLRLLQTQACKNAASSLAC